MLSEERDSSPIRNVDDFRSSVDSGSDNVVRYLSGRTTLEDKLPTKMFLYARELFFVLALLFTALAALHTSPPRISKPPPARPFFNQSSVVLDFYKGHLGAVFERVTQTDLSFVMYYAPWDAESQAVRQEFEAVAQYYQKQIFFAAINCWHPGSECRAQYSKIQSYPVLMLYPRRGSGIQYGGIRIAPYMIRFLHAFMNPIHRVTSKQQLVDLIVDYDAVVIGYFNFTGLARGPGYKEFYKTAVRALERDPNRELLFAAVTDAESGSYDHGATTFPSAQLLMWNESLVFPQDLEWKSETLFKWLSSTLHQAALWIQPPGTKSFTLAPYLHDGPVLFLFTPRKPLHPRNYNYNLMREIGLQYYNCGDNLQVDKIVKNLESVRLGAAQRHRERTKQCARLLEESRVQQMALTVSVSDQRWINDSCCAKIVTNKCSLCKKKVPALMAQKPSTCTISDELGHICRSTDVFSVPIVSEEFETHELCCRDEDMTVDTLENVLETKSKKYKTSMLTGENDPYSATAITKSLLKDDCRRLLAGNKYHPAVFPRDSKQQPDIKLTTSICKVNKTLALIAIDSLHFFHFAERLGINILERRDKTAVVILDPTQESQYVMQENLSRYTFVQFINNYTEGMLQRALRSDGQIRFGQSHTKIVDCSVSEDSTICVPELTTDTFSNTILNPEQDVVVMYHSPYCAFCHAVSYAYLTVAQYLSKMHHLIFVRVDGDSNDLPWEYTMNRYPSILFFPAKRKEDSTVFPFSLPITIPNLLNFVLANLDADSHVEALINICQMGLGETPGDCVLRIRRLSLEIIEDLLRDYRKLRRNLSGMAKKTTSKKLRVLLLRLQHIREIHLILGSTVDLQKDEVKVHLIQEKFRVYYRDLALLHVSSKVASNNVDGDQRRVVRTDKIRNEL